MLNWFQALLPKEDKFFDLFEAHAATLVRPARGRCASCWTAARTCPRTAPTIADHEDEADDIAREVLLAVRRTFITPFDRGDINDLITSLDDAIDQMQKTAKAITLFEVSARSSRDMRRDGRHHRAGAPS